MLYHFYFICQDENGDTTSDFSSRYLLYKLTYIVRKEYGILYISYNDNKPFVLIFKLIKLSLNSFALILKELINSSISSFVSKNKSCCRKNPFY